MLEETADREEIIQRVAALDIGKAEVVCCVRVPQEGRAGRRLQEVETYSTMTRSLDHHAFLLGKMLARIDGIDADIAELDARSPPPSSSPKLAWI